jgi:hypothetical protein
MIVLIGAACTEVYEADKLAELLQAPALIVIGFWFGIRAASARAGWPPSL